MRQAIFSAKNPQAIGCYSPAVRSEGWLWISGQIPIDPETLALVSTDIEPQIHQVFYFLSNLLKEANLGFEHVVKMTIYLTDLKNFEKVNRVMSEYMSQPYPARVTVEVSGLPKGASIEIDAIAVFPKS